MSWLLRLFAVILFFSSPLFAAEVADDHPSGIRKMAMVYEHGRGVKKIIGKLTNCIVRRH